MEVIKCADWIIDLGPEGGEKGEKFVLKVHRKKWSNWKTTIPLPFLNKK